MIWHYDQRVLLESLERVLLGISYLISAKTMGPIIQYHEAAVQIRCIPISYACRPCHQAPHTPP